MAAASRRAQTRRPPQRCHAAQRGGHGPTAPSGPTRDDRDGGQAKRAGGSPTSVGSTFTPPPGWSSHRQMVPVTTNESAKGKRNTPRKRPSPLRVPCMARSRASLLRSIQRREGSVELAEKSLSGPTPHLSALRLYLTVPGTPNWVAGCDGITGFGLGMLFKLRDPREPVWELVGPMEVPGCPIPVGELLVPMGAPGCPIPVGELVVPMEAPGCAVPIWELNVPVGAPGCPIRIWKLVVPMDCACATPPAAAVSAMAVMSERLSFDDICFSFPRRDLPVLGFGLGSA